MTRGSRELVVLMMMFFGGTFKGIGRTSAELGLRTAPRFPHAGFTGSFIPASQQG